MKFGVVDFGIPRVGLPVTVRNQNMPYIDDNVLECVIYLYPTVDDANEGVSVGGTGFLVSIGFKDHDSLEHVYAITNEHVVSTRESMGQSPIIRLNTHEGKHDVLPLTFSRWLAHPHGDDIAVAPLGQIDRQRFVYQSINPDSFISKVDVQHRQVYAGHEALTVGRFISHEGKQKNTPSVRFGNISVMPFEGIELGDGRQQESFLVETRSLSGYSGSPVFVYDALPHVERLDAKLQKRGYGIEVRRREKHRPSNVRLLGIDYAHMVIYEPVYEMTGREYLETNFVAKSNSGQMAVVPAWKLSEMLFSAALQEMRNEVEREYEQHTSPLDFNEPAYGVTLNPKFEDALRRARQLLNHKGNL
jgi:hypothetical protein